MSPNTSHLPLELEKQRLRREIARLRPRLDRHVERLLIPTLAASAAAPQKHSANLEGLEWPDYVRRYPQWSLLAAFAVGWAASLPAGRNCLTNALAGALIPLLRPWLDKLWATLGPAAESATPNSTAKHEE